MRCLLLLLLLPLWGKSQNTDVKIVEATPAILYKGTIAGAPARIMISLDIGPVEGILFYEKTGVPFWLKGERRGDSLFLNEYLDEDEFSYEDTPSSKHTGSMRLLLSGQSQLNGDWSPAQGGKRRPVALSWELASQPFHWNSAERVREATTQMELITLLACAYTGPHPSLLWIEKQPEDGQYSGEPIAAHLVQPGEVTISTEPFSEPRRSGQILYRIDIRDYRVLFAAATLIPHERQERRTLSLLCTEALWDQVWCLDEADTSFVRHQTVPVCDGRKLLDLQATAAMCFTATRGSDVQRVLARVGDNGWEIVTSFKQQSYWYNSPCPQPINLPVDAVGEYKTAQGDSLPSLLEITHVQYEWEKEGTSEEEYEGCGPYAEEVGKKVERVRLCR